MLRAFLAATLLTTTSACVRPVGLPGDEVPLTGASKRLMPTHLRPGWRRDFSDQRLESVKQVHLAAPAVDGARDRLCLGTPDGYIECMTASSGETLWRKWIPARISNEGETAGNLEAQAVADEAREAKSRIRRTANSTAVFDAGQLLVGTDDGLLLCLDSKSGEEIWRYEVPGALTQPPVLAGERILVVDGTNTIYALDRSNGKWVWQIDRPPPAEFALSGEARPISDGERAYVGFSDGTLLALNLSDGAQIWKRDLAPEHDKFEDVDATPVLQNGTLFAASAASALYALDPMSGEVRWTQPQPGIVGMVGYEGDLILSTDRSSVIRASGHDGRTRWRLRFPGGAPTSAQLAGKLLVVTMSEMGMQFIDAENGQPVQRFNPGQGISASPTIADNGDVYILGDAGVLYQLAQRAAPRGSRSDRASAPFDSFGLDR